MDKIDAIYEKLNEIKLLVDKHLRGDEECKVNLQHVMMSLELAKQMIQKEVEFSEESALLTDKA